MCPGWSAATYNPVTSSRNFPSVLQALSLICTPACASDHCCICFLNHFLQCGVMNILILRTVTQKIYSKWVNERMREKRRKKEVNFMECLFIIKQKKITDSFKCMCLKHMFCTLYLLPGWHSGEEYTCQCRRCRKCRFDPYVRKIPWKRERELTPVFLPG